METKPLKRNVNIVKLSQDHHASLLFCWKIRQGIKYHISFDRLLDYVHYFWRNHFSKHFKEEEQFLFKPYIDETIGKAIEDHHKIKELINKLQSETPSKRNDLLSELAETVNQHVRYEERILFPHLEARLSDEQLAVIGTQINEEPLQDNYQDNYQDNFWTKPVSL